MKFTKIKSLSLAVVIGLAAMLTTLGLLGMTSPVVAQEHESTRHVNSASMVPVWTSDIQAGDPTTDYLAIETEPILLEVLDLAGNPVGEGLHSGKLRCLVKCNKKMELTLGEVKFEYRFTTLQVLDPDTGRFVIGGSGTVDYGRQRERFSFTAIFQDNGDGTITVTYEASRPDASFIIPNVSGTIEC